MDAQLLKQIERYTNQFTAFSFSLDLDSLQRLEKANTPANNWEVQFHLKQIKETIAKEIKIESGDLSVFYRQKEASVFQLQKPEDIQGWQRLEPWEIPLIYRKKCYDADQQCLLGQIVKRSSVFYEYIPAENMVDGVPFIISSGVCYDGGEEQKSALAAGALRVPYNKLKETFTNNKFD